MSPTRLTIKADDWSLAHIIRITGVLDPDNNNEDVALSHAVTGYSNPDTRQEVTTAIDFLVQVVDRNDPGVTINPTTLEITEGFEDAYSISLRTQPSGTVTVTIAGHDGTDVRLGTDRLFFSSSNWNEPQAVTVMTDEDADAEDDKVTLTHTVSDYGTVTTAEAVTVTIVERDQEGIIVTAVTPQLEDPNEGDTPATGMYTVMLATQPTGDVMVEITSSNDDVTVMPEMLTFTMMDWNQPQTVTVTAAGDTDATDDTATLRHQASGSMYSGFATVTVTVTDLDDPPIAPVRRPVTRPGGGGGGGGGGAPLNRSPEFSGGSTTNRSVAENTPAGANIGDPIGATDREDDTLTYSLRGVDAESFDIDPATGQLLTKAPLDHEAQAAYSVIVSVSDGKSSSGRDSDARDDSVTVTIDVENVDEPGAVALSSYQPQVDVALTATLTDLDGGLAGIVWLWERSADQADWTEINGARTASYTPVVGDLSSYLRVTASYTDGHGRGKSAGAVTGDPVLINTVPRFPGVDADGGIAIEVEEGSGDAESGGIGEPVAAADPDGDTLTYSLSGDDAGSFEIDASTGQLWSNAPLDYETQAVYTVVVSVRDGRDFNGDPDTAVDAEVTVTIAVVNVGEPGTLTLLSSEPRVGVPFAARLTDPDGVVGEVAWQWERSRDGNPWSSSWRAISGAESSAYEPVDADLGYYLRVTASYADGHGPDKSRQAISDAAVMENTGPVFPDALNGVFERSVGGERWRGRGRGRSGGGNKSRRRRADLCARRHRRGAVRHRRGHGADQGRDGAGLRGGQERLRGDRHGHGRIGG